MSQWLVSHVPSWLLLIGMVTGTAGTAIVIQLVVRRRFPNLRGEEHNDVTKFAFAVVGFVFAFFIGFVVSAMWGQISHADDLVRTEGTAGAQLARDSHIFNQPDRERIRLSLLEYEQAAIIEWDEINEGRSYPAADQALNRLYAAYEAITPDTDAQKTLLSTSFSNLNDLSKNRAERILQARTDTGPPWSLWAVIFVTSGPSAGLRHHLRRGEGRQPLRHGGHHRNARRRSTLPRGRAFPPVCGSGVHGPRTASTSHTDPPGHPLGGGWIWRRHGQHRQQIHATGNQLGESRSANDRRGVIYGKHNQPTRRGDPRRRTCVVLRRKETHELRQQHWSRRSACSDTGCRLGCRICIRSRIRRHRRFLVIERIIERFVVEFDGLILG